MSASKLNIDSNAKAAIRPMLMGLPRPIAGALIGIFSFLIIVGIFWSTKLITAFLILLSPGILTAWIILPTIAWSTSITAKIINYSVLFGISAIPPGILGSLIISKENATRLKGILLSMIYLIVLLVMGVPISTLFD
jgi:hypothetical protein